MHARTRNARINPLTTPRAAALARQDVPPPHEPRFHETVVMDPSEMYRLMEQRGWQVPTARYNESGMNSSPIMLDKINGTQSARAPQFPLIGAPRNSVGGKMTSLRGWNIRVR